MGGSVLIQEFMKADQKMANDQHILDEWVEHDRDLAKNGECAGYIPALAKEDPAKLGIYMIGPDGVSMKSGDWESTFTLQSISKVVSFMSVCLEKGISDVLERVDVEPTGDAFNSILRLEMNKPGRPFNPMINAGAIVVSSMLSGESPEEKVDSLLNFLENMVGRRLNFNEEVFQSEWNTAHRNRALAHYLRSSGFLQAEVEEAIYVYLKQCALEVSTADIAKIGLILSQDGYDPIQKIQLIPKEVARLTKALMITCGMYDASGKFAAFVGVPAKSGVSGGIMAAVPPRSRGKSPFETGCGIGIYGPAIDEFGNSKAGVELIKHVAHTWDLSIF
jgi:glutaminase